MVCSTTRSSFSVKDIQDDVGGTFELEILPKAEEQKRRKFVDDVEEGTKVKSISELNNLKVMHHKDSGDRGKDYSPKHDEGKPAKGNHQLQRVVSDRPQNGDKVYNRGFPRPNSSQQQQSGLKTRPNIPNISWRRMSTWSTVKNTRSPPSWPNSSSGRLSNRSFASSMGQVGASHSRSAKQSRADELGVCSECNKKFPNLSTVGCHFLCSVCRRKSKAVDPSLSSNTNCKTPAANSIWGVPSHRNGKRGRDVVGGTPDTAMEIDSSDNDDEAENGTRSEMNPCEQQGLQSAVNSMESLKIAYPSRTDPDAVEILASDIQRLNPLEFLNDTIIDFYIKYIQREFLGLEQGRRFHFFNSFFYKKLSSVIGKKKKKKVVDYSNLRKWTRGVNIFEKDYLFIPVHDRLHWSLAIVCFPNHGPGSATGCERCVLHLDSMTCGHNSLNVFRLLRSFLVAEGADLKGDDNINPITYNVIPAKKVLVPLQENDSDCGLFLLHYIRKFVESAPKTMKISDVDNGSEDIGVFGRQWFCPIEASSLRTSIQEQLQRLFAEKDEEALGMSMDARLETLEAGIPRKLEAEFCLAKSSGPRFDELSQTTRVLRGAASKSDCGFYDLKTRYTKVTKFIEALCSGTPELTHVTIDCFAFNYWVSPASMTSAGDISSLLEASDAFFANVTPPTSNNLIRNIIDRSSSPAETSARIVHHANNTRILVHSRVLPLLDAFLTHKRSHGSEKEQELYREMTRDALVRRLIRNRPLAFYNRTDITLLRDKSKPNGREWEKVGTSNEGKIHLEDYLSYDEIQIAALLGVSSPTLFINSGDRFNDAELGDPKTFEPEGIYIGLVGARFQKPEKMDNQHLIVFQASSRPEFGFGAEGASLNPTAAAALQPFATLFSQSHFPSYEEALGDTTSGNFHRLFSNSSCFFNVAAYKARIRIPIECLLVEANDRGKEAGKKAYAFLVGLGLGVWMKCDEQARWMVDVVGDVLQETVLPDLADVDFNWFPEAVHSCAGVSSGEAITGAGGNQIAIHFTNRSPADPLPPSPEPKLLVACYAWDGNAFPGNEYWKGLTCSSGDPAAVCCSTIGELQNAWINPGFLDRQYVIQPNKIAAVDAI